jgi:hypothetical protein
MILLNAQVVVYERAIRQSVLVEGVVETVVSDVVHHGSDEEREDLNLTARMFACAHMYFACALLV